MVLFDLVKFNPLKTFVNSIQKSPVRHKYISKKPKRIFSEYSKSVRIWSGMTIWDLAVSMRQNLDYIEKTIKPALGKYVSENGIIKNKQAIEIFLKRENYFYKEVNVKTLPENVNKVLKPAIPVIEVPQNQINEVKRPPVVAIMGHVDHGKTTLLDALRSSNIVAGEAGGITQHIGAFSVSVAPNETITFIDTPGHAAFRNMRNRGAEVTDIVVLIVAADDGVMEQTIESIKMAKRAKVNIVVAVNKIDKVPEGNILKIKEQLITQGLQADDLGGSVQVVGISALKKKNLGLLTEAILLEAAMLDLKSDPNAPFEGVVIESFMDKRGKLATVLVKRGTLRKRAVLLAGTAIVRVKFMFDENGTELSEATLSQPARIGAWNEIPKPGDKVVEVKSEKEANRYTKATKRKELEQKNASDFVLLKEKLVQAKAENTENRKTYLRLKNAADYAGLKEFYKNKKKVEKPEKKLKLDIIVKGDTNGSVDAILDILNSYNAEKYCLLNIVSHGVGNVTESDINLAMTFDATIYCFNLDYPQALKQEITENNIRIKLHNVIYKLVDDLKFEISALLPLKDEEKIRGQGEILEYFVINEKKKKVSVGGCMCLTGEFKKNLTYRIERNDEVIHEGEIKCLKHFKNEVNTIKKDQQCGIMFKNFEGNFKTGDKIICFEIVQVPGVIPWNPGF